MTYTAFLGHKRIAQGELPAVARAAAAAQRKDAASPLLVFNDADGLQVELDLRGSPADAQQRALAAASSSPGTAAAPRPRGRPSLGVVAREVTLLPRHWEWLAVQPGGASVALRKLVDEARKAQGGRDRVRAAQERTYRFLHAIAGDMAGYEEALRALYARNAEAFEESIRSWPKDLRTHALQLADEVFEAAAAL